MKIKSLMVKNPITIRRDTTIETALALMKSKGIRHLPVVTSEQRLLGLVTLADLREGLIPSMVSGLSLKDLMIRNPVHVSPEDDIERAARRIYRHKISGMPVVQDDILVGIITETDILRAFIDMMGILNAGCHFEIDVEESPDHLNRVLQMIQESDGDILNVSFIGKSGGKRRYSFRLGPCETDRIRRALESEGFTVHD